jgi:7-keto-8-aminopelargonate synthetase-like enzyme
MQEYNAMKAAGATEAELLHQKQLVDRAILAEAKSQKTVGTAGKALSAVDGVAISPFKTAAFSQLGHPSILYSKTSPSAFV